VVTHWSYDINKSGSRFVGNQLGYNSEIGKTGLNEHGLFEIIFYTFYALLTLSFVVGLEYLVSY